jgi:UDP-N-acetylglucosamine--dolichyl-phosphate N-acetylglucosaminephosphotransferase
MILIAFILSLAATVFVTPFFISFFLKTGIYGLDIHKKEKSKVAEMGAPPVIFGFLIGIFFLIGMITFVYGDGSLIDFFAVISTMLIITFIGFIDDLSTLTKGKITFKGAKIKKRKGLRQYQKAILPLLGAIPLMAINAGVSSMSLPLIGSVNFGLFYPLVLIPLGIIVASSGFNMLAGMNGLESGLGIIILLSLSVFTYIQGEIIASYLALTFVGALLGFWIYNKYPAKIMPGDSLTYLIGAVIASIAIVGNVEKFVFIAFGPWIIEFILKARGRFQKESFGILQKDGTLKAPYKKTYSLTHVVMKLGKFKEKQVVLFLYMIGILFSALAFLISIY